MYSPRPPAPIAAAIVAVPDAERRRDANAGDDRRQGERELDEPEQLPRRHPHRRRRPRRAAGRYDGAPRRSFGRWAAGRRGSARRRPRGRRRRRRTAPAAGSRTSRGSESSGRRSRSRPAARRGGAAGRRGRRAARRRRRRSTWTPGPATRAARAGRATPGGASPRSGAAVTRGLRGRIGRPGVPGRRQERPDARVAGGGETPGRLAGDEAPVGEHGHAVPQRKRLGHVVRDDDDGLAQASWMRRNSPCSSPRVIGSSAPNGSSMSRIGGSTASARATPTRCRCPPDSSSGQRPA